MSAEQVGNRTQVLLKVRFANIDNPADFIDVPGLGYGVDDQDKGPGKATSYAVKYCLLKALGLETGDDPDLDDQPHKPPAKPPHDAQVRAALAQIDVPPAAKPDSVPDDWQIIGNDILAAVSRLQTKKAINTYVATHRNDLDNLQKHANAEYQRVKGGIEARHALLPAMQP